MGKNVKMNLLRDKRSSVEQQADFFNALGSDYTDTVAREYSTIYTRTVNAINGHIRGDLLDIGSGGVNLFSSAGIHLFYDISPVLLSLHSRVDEQSRVKNRGAVQSGANSIGAVQSGVNSIGAVQSGVNSMGAVQSGNRSRFQVCGESATLPFISESFDTVLFHFSIHHFAQERFSLTVDYVERAIHEAKRVLRPEGKVIIAENTVSDSLEMAESLLFPVVSKSLEILNSPPVFLFSEKRLARILSKARLTSDTICSFKEPSRLLVSPLNMRLRLNPVTIKVLVASNV